jgi:hypothetical protein
MIMHHQIFRVALAALAAAIVVGHGYHAAVHESAFDAVDGSSTGT